jgi:uncharacterized protein (DUF1697 family)
MSSYVALLYSIVLTPQRRVMMADLRTMALDLGFEAPRTLVSTGNLVFEATETPIAQLESALEATFAQRFGRHVDIIVRDAVNWRRLAVDNPFPVESEIDADRVLVRVMRKPLDNDVVPILRPYLTQGERMAVVNGDLWTYFAGQPNKSRLLPALTPKRLGIGTSRNWNTIRGLGEMLFV